MSNVWFTSDPHIQHAAIAATRGFATAEEHDEVLRDKWNTTVRKGDTAWVLGDLTLPQSGPRVQRMLDYFAALKGTKHLIVGNHDAVSPIHRDGHKWQRQYLEVFGSVQAYARRRGPCGDVLLSHYPYSDDHTEVPRFQQFRLPDLGSGLIHGHTHSKLRITGPRQVHVGMDAWDMTPVHMDVAYELLVSCSGEPSPR